jgi:hypothetical protein
MHSLKDNVQRMLSLPGSWTGRRPEGACSCCRRCWRSGPYSPVELADCVGQLLQGVETGQRPEWKDIADSTPIYKSYRAQEKSLAVRDGVLERHWVSADGRTKMSQIVIPRSKVKEMLAEMYGGHSGGHFGVKTLNKVRRRYYWLHSRSDVEMVSTVRHLRSKSRSQNKEPEPDAPVQRRGTLWEDRHGHCWTSPEGWEGKW